MMKMVFGAVLGLILLPALASAQETPEPPPAEASEATPEETAPAPEAATAAPADPKAPTSVTGQVGAIAAANSPEELRTRRGFTHGMSLDHSVGSGTFVNPAYFADVGAALGLNTSYSFALGPVPVSASAGMNFNYEYSLPDNGNGRRFNWSDIRLGLSAPALVREKLTQITVSPNFGASVPISLNSIHNSTITVLSAGVGLNRVFFEKLSVGYRLGGARGLHGNPANLQSISPNRDSLGNLIYICRTQEQFCGSAGMNSAWSLTNSFSAGYTFSPKLSAGASLAFVKSWRYAATDELDEFTPKAIDSNGNPVARVGMGQADTMSGSLSVGYAMTDRFSISGNMGTSSAPKTNDNKNFRFPFFDFVSSANSLTSFSLGLSARL